MIKDRATRVDALLAANGLSALVFFDLANIRYLCGFSGTDGVLAVGPEGDCFLTDSRYTTQAAAQVVADELREYRVKLEGVGSWLQEQKVRRVGFEAGSLPFATVTRLQKRCPAIEWVPLDEELQPLRSIKDPGEKEVLRRAARLNRIAFEEVVEQIRPGVSEREVALALEFSLKRQGGEDKAFDFIVASGPRGALPHGVASERQIGRGELVTIDFGVRCNGYHSDETVTLAVGGVEDRLREIFDITLAAHDRALAAIRPGIALRELDAVARDHIAACGFGDFFGHGLGHGVGLEIHEYPTLSPRSEALAEEGMVFTVEPGIYLPERGGVRIEDTVEVTADGYRLVTEIPKNWRCLPC